MGRFLSTDRYGWVPTLPDWLPLEAVESVDASLLGIYEADHTYSPPRALLRKSAVENSELMSTARAKLLDKALFDGELRWSATEMEVQLALRLEEIAKEN